MGERFQSIGREEKGRYKTKVMERTVVVYSAGQIETNRLGISYRLESIRLDSNRHGAIQLLDSIVKIELRRID